MDRKTTDGPQENNAKARSLMGFRFYLDLNIRSFNISAKDGYFEANISLLVRNTDQLFLAMRGLQNLDNISTVSRVE